MGYWISITGNRVAAISSANADKLIYAGLFTPHAQHTAAAGASAFPLVTARLSAAGDAAGSISAASSVTALLPRVPKATALTASGWGFIPTLKAYGPYDLCPPLPTGVLLVQAKVLTFPVAVGVSPTYVAGAGGGFLGTLDGVAMTGSVGTARGDTVTIGPDTWVLGTSSGTTSILFKAV